MAADPTFRRYVIDELLRAAGELGIAIKELSPHEIERVRAELGDRYGLEGHLITFQNMREKASLQNPDAWRLLSGFLAPVPHIIFYESPGFHDRSGILLEDGSKIPDLIGETFGFPFYVTDLEQSFVIGMNDHDFLIGTGRAKPWVQSLPPWHPPSA